MKFHDENKKKVSLIVVDESGSNLLGSEWSDDFGQTSESIHINFKSRESALYVGGLTKSSESVVNTKIFLFKTK